MRSTLSKNVKRSLFKRILLIIFPFIVWGIFFIFFNYDFEKKFPRPDSLLYINTIDSTSSIIVLNHNQFLSNTLLQHLSLASQDKLAQDDSRIQTRLFYAAILTALISFILSDKNKNNRNKKGKIILTISVIILMYLLDVHLLDLGWRKHQASITISKTKDSLQNTPNTTNWYKIDFNKLYDFNKKQECDHIGRKLCRLIKPEFAQMIFYIIPLCILWIYFVCELIKPHIMYRPKQRLLRRRNI